MSNPDLSLWTSLLARIAAEVAGVTALALLLERLVRAAAWRRALWQSAIVCLLCMVLSEVTGFGRGVASYLFGRSRSETKYLVAASSAENVIQPPSPKPAAVSVAPMILSNPKSSLEPVRPVWWPGIVWLTGAVLITTRVAAAQILFVSLRRRRRRVAAQDLHARVADILMQLGCHRKIRLIECPKLASPIAFGILHPSIGLPAHFTGNYSVDQQNAMLAHELAHLASHDPLWYLLADIACALSWWHPSAWWARRRLQHATELAADEAAVVLPGGPALLAQCLVNLGRQMAHRTPAVPIGMEGGLRSSLAERVQRLISMAPTAGRPAFGGKARAANYASLFAVSAVAIILTGCLQNRHAVKQSSLQANLTQSWEASAVSSVWRSARTVDRSEAEVSTAIPIILQTTSAEEKAPSAAASTNTANDHAAISVTNSITMTLTNLSTNRTSHVVPIAPVSTNKSASTISNVVETLATNYQVHTSPGRSRIMRKLNGIRLAVLPDDFQKDLPLSEVLKILRKVSISNDLENLGVPFLFKPRINETNTPVDPAAITIKMHSTLENVSLLEVLDAIRQVSDTPISYSVEDYAVWFFAKAPEAVPLENRRFRVNPGTFLQEVAPNSPTSDTLANHAMIARYFSTMGVNLSSNGAAVFLNTRTGDLFVRATRPDLDTLEGVIAVLNQVPPHVRIDVKFVSAASDDAYQGLGFDWPTPAKPIPIATVPAVVGLLHEAEFRATVQALEQRDGVEMLSMRRVTVENGRQAHVETGVNGIATTARRDATVSNLSHSIDQGASSSPAAITNRDSAAPSPALDLVPYVAGDGYFIQTTLIPSYTEFIGYDSPGSFGLADPPGSTNQPLPHYRVRQSATTTNIFDGETIVMRETRPSAGAKPQPDILIFITPRIVDAAGQPVHTDAVLKASLPPNPLPATETSVPK